MSAKSVVSTSPAPSAITGKRTVVAMSGGVDSSVAAALLKRAGRDVIGITLQLYDSAAAAGRKGACCAGQDIQDARKVAEAIGIPHYVLDYEAKFATSVIDAFAESYVAGETPIPCVNCNQQIKFRDLLDTAQELGAVTLATGHYIQKRDGERGPELYRAADSDRDQSYFLFATRRDQLARLEFPLGGMRKGEVRALAREWGLPVADKADSQDICFVPKGHYSDVIERLKPGSHRPGEIIHADGRVLGQHDGIVGYTIGQRRGLGIPSSEPLYVLKLDAARNRIVVGPHDLLRTAAVVLKNVNWLGDIPLAQTPGLTVRVRLRSTQRPQPAALHCEADGRIKVVLQEGEFGIAPGQACVFYWNEEPESRILGGGWIERTIGPSAETVVGAEVERGSLSPAKGTRPQHGVRGARG